MKSPFKTLIIREIQSAIIDFRFWVVFALCLSIIPFSFYVSVKNYSQRLSNYQQEVQAYRDNTQIRSDFVAQGVHPPSPLSIFSIGLDAKMPFKVFTSNDGDYKIEYARPNSKKDLLGEIDFAFIVSFVLSILAIVFTFSSISGDKESGIMRLVLSNRVSRKQLLMSKLIGNYVVFLAPFLLSLLIALLIIYLSGIIPIFSKELIIPVLIMVGISLLYILVMFNLGLWISSLTRNSILSVNVLLLIWIVLGLVVPKISPIIGAVVYPVESSGVFEAQKTLLRQSIIKEQEKAERDLYIGIRTQLRPQETDDVSGRWTDVNSAYDEQIIPVWEKYKQLLNSETEKLVNDYTIRRNRQDAVAKNIARLSPVYLVNKLMAEFSGTGYSEEDYFIRQAAVYQAHVKQYFYDKMPIKIYRGERGYMSQAAGDTKDWPINEPVPTLENYKSVSIGQIFVQNRVDIALLGFYCLLFFVCGFVSFLRFDVR
jgi:ABC-type transport system involved in multi-copper enzyme maturation permease subunit